MALYSKHVVTMMMSRYEGLRKVIRVWKVYVYRNGGRRSKTLPDAILGAPALALRLLRVGTRFGWSPQILLIDVLATTFHDRSNVEQCDFFMICSVRIPPSHSGGVSRHKQNNSKLPFGNTKNQI